MWKLTISMGYLVYLSIPLDQKWGKLENFPLFFFFKVSLGMTHLDISWPISLRYKWMPGGQSHHGPYGLAEWIAGMSKCRLWSSGPKSQVSWGNLGVKLRRFAIIGTTWNIQGIHGLSRKDHLWQMRGSQKIGKYSKKIWLHIKTSS